MKESIYPLGVVLLVFLVALPAVVQAQGCTNPALHDEFFTDVTGRGYVTCATDANLAGPNVSDTCVLGLFNAACTNHASCKADNILTREQIYETIIDSAELDTLANSTAPADAKRKTTLGWLLTGQSWNLAKSSNLQKWKNVFTGPSSPITNAALDAQKQKDAPRSQSVCGRVGTIDDVSCGLRGSSCP
jgi:hypothetical protein